ncbi:MAG: cytochrome C oxidase subunit IV family protein [Cyclobacteriaceae bacterium]|nr:cytochrome C oxidase subunit IV family protein [Cyclobacteriaceae bacterium]
MSSEETTNVQVIPADKAKIKHIWTVAGILGFITTLEFIVAFTISTGMLKLSIFVVMTIVKAAYIVGEFMHLKHESKVLMWSILLPMIFVVWMLIAFRYEAGAILDLRGW